MTYSDTITISIVLIVSYSNSILRLILNLIFLLNVGNYHATSTLIFILILLLVVKLNDAFNARFII